ncbi:MAG TPA: hypothetical protein P5235_06055 [Saprospiraceae bacterium]|nr:hypothetical protein [Saprospiraceae bacterium]
MKNSAFIIGFIIFLCFQGIGQEYRLYITLLEDCPICVQYTDELNVLYSQYGDLVDFEGIFPNFISKKENIANFKNQYNIGFPLKTDYFKTITNKYNCKVTPEVVLIDANNEQIIYKGAIDNSYLMPGKQRKSGIIHYLADVLEDIRNKKAPRHNHTQAVGCFINFSDKLSKN